MLRKTLRTLRIALANGITRASRHLAAVCHAQCYGLTTFGRFEENLGSRVSVGSEARRADYACLSLTVEPPVAAGSAGLERETESHLADSASSGGRHSRIVNTTPNHGAATNSSVRHGTCSHRHLSARHAGAAPAPPVAELEVVRRCFTARV